MPGTVSLKLGRLFWRVVAGRFHRLCPNQRIGWEQTLGEAIPEQYNPLSFLEDIREIPELWVMSDLQTPDPQMPEEIPLNSVGFQSFQLTEGVVRAIKLSPEVKVCHFSSFLFLTCV